MKSGTFPKKKKEEEEQIGTRRVTGARTQQTTNCFLWITSKTVHACDQPIEEACLSCKYSATFTASRKTATRGHNTDSVQYGTFVNIIPIVVHARSCSLRVSRSVVSEILWRNFSPFGDRRTFSPVSGPAARPPNVLSHFYFSNAKALRVSR